MGEGKPGWRRLSFSEMVTSAGATRKARGWDVNSAGVDRYVGLEHLDSNSLPIRRWGDPRDVGENSDIRHFEAGDVLLARRGIDLRKVGRAHFRGVASGHALVFRAKPRIVLPGFLPFFMQSSVFMARADRRSVGSLSKTVNLSALMREEFAIPPLEQQAQIIEILVPLEGARTAARDALAAGEEAFAILNWQATTGALAAGPRTPVRSWRYACLPGVNDLPSTWEITTLTDVARLESGHTPSKRRDDYWNGGIPWISLADIKRLGVPEIDATEHEVAQLGLENSSARLLPPGTVVLSRTAMIGFTSVMGREMATSQDFANFVCDEKRLLPRFLFYLFLSMQEYFDYIAIGSSNVNTIYMPFFKRMQIPLPPLGEQAEIVELLDEMWAGLEALRARVASHASLLQATREALIGNGAP